jgi:sulfite reductase (NADPH) flavoprotein alpha-component
MGVSISVPFLPETAPFTAEQRQWLNGFLAGIFSDQNQPAQVSSLESKGRAVVMFGSQSGNAESLAEDCAGQLRAAGFDAPVVDMAEHEDVDLGKEQHLIIFTSTWGEGDPPDNAVEFWERLSSDEQVSLDGLKFAVCGLGDSNYLDFCGMGKRFDSRLEELGATRMLPRVDCDVDFEETAGAWSLDLLTSIGETSATPSAVSKSPAAEPEVFSKKNPFRAALLKNLQLNCSGSERDTRHFEISLDGSGLEYEAGDALGVVPANCPEIAAELIGAFGWSGDEEVVTPSGERKPLLQAFIHDYAITLPSKKLVAAYSERSGEAIESDYLYGREIIDLATDYPSVSFSPDELVSLLGKLQPRLYSISSSPKAHPGEVHLTVATVRYDAHGRQRKGVCSTFLAERCNGDGARVFVHPAKGFKPPADLSAKMIMVGPGTGIAPFRAFLEERRETGATGGNWLFFGNPHRSTDFLYKGELTQMIEDGHLHRFDAAWSRDGDEKVYVQDRMRENGEELWRWLEDGAHFYVCGDAKRMAKDVDAVLHEVVATHGGKGEGGAAEFVSQMKKDRRYQRDVY